MLLAALWEYKAITNPLSRPKRYSKTFHRVLKLILYFNISSQSSSWEAWGAYSHVVAIIVVCRPLLWCPSFEYVRWPYGHYAVPKWELVDKEIFGRWGYIEYLELCWRSQSAGVDSPTASTLRQLPKSAPKMPRPVKLEEPAEHLPSIP